MFNRNGVAKLPAVEWRSAIFRKVLWRQVGAILALTVLSALLSPSVWAAAIPVAAILLGWGLTALTMRVKRWRQGHLSTEAALYHGTELVGPNAEPELNQLLDQFSADVGCQRPRFFTLPSGQDDESPGSMWLCGKRPCIALSVTLLTTLPQLVKYTMAHEFAHILMDDMRKRFGVLAKNIVVMNTALIAVMWSMVTLIWSHAAGVGMGEFLIHLVAAFGSCAVFVWLWYRTLAWLGWVMQVSEFAADAVGAALVGSRGEAASALYALGMHFGGPNSLYQSDPSHPSIARRIQVLVEE